MTTTTQQQAKKISRFTLWTSAAFTAALITAYVTPAHAAWQTPAEAMQVAAAETAPAASQPSEVTVTGKPSFFTISNDDVAAEVERQLQDQGFKDGVKATVNPGASPTLAAADHPLKVVIHALQVDTDAHLWQGQAYIMAGNKTESMKPVAGRYESVVTVPFVTRQFRKGDIIAEGDIEMHKVPERQLRKDTVTSASQLIGQSPVRGISAGRPIRLAEISSPILIKKGEPVEMLYSTPYMTIRTTGEALEDGGKDALIRIQNTKSQKAVSGRVVAAGQVQVNPEAAL